MSIPQITVVGSYNTDLTTFTAYMPQPGETVLGKHFQTGPGGKGSNQTVAAARLGSAVAFVGRIGQDMFGQMALNVWQGEGINTSHVIQSADAPTGVATILVDDAGENIIVVASGANWTVSPADIEQAAPTIAQSKILLIQLEIPLDAVVQAMQIARQHQVSIILNPAPGQPLTRDILQLADIITPNQTEAEIITGIPATNPENAAAALRDHGANTVVMTLGSQGVLLYDDDGPRRFPAFKATAVDTTGAGDAFNGALAVALAEGNPLDKAIRFACAAAAISVTRPGATDSMPTRQEVEQLLADA